MPNMKSFSIVNCKTQVKSGLQMEWKSKENMDTKRNPEPTLKWYPGDGQNYDSSKPSIGATFSVLVTDDGKEEILYTRRNRDVP